ncbi:hypothetical protein [Achromobacter kerstersii]|jgi:hypothetical protein|uniref:hypothetical protein n=1 Tax=Achromobacter kerstersii TaxID=1353890 RepID=UPI00313CBB31
MSWLTLSIVIIVAVAAGAVLLRHPGVLLFDWIATRKAVRVRAARARAIAPAMKAHQQAAPVEHPAALAG